MVAAGPLPSGIGSELLLRLYKNRVPVSTLSTTPHFSHSAMTASLHSSETATHDPSQDHDPEALGKALSIPTEGDVNISEKSPSPWEVTLDKSEDPKTMKTWYKWATVLTVSSGAMCVTCASSMVSLTRKIRLPSDLGSNALAPLGCFC